MLDLPKPMLGDVNAITITSPDLEKSLAYYKMLGFSELYRGDFPFPFIQVSDGAIQVMIRKDPTPYCALTYYVKDLDRVVGELEAAGITFFQKAGPKDMIKRYLFRSPDDLVISLVTFVDGFSQPPGPTMLTMPPQDYMNPEKYPNKVCGLFGEFCHPVSDLQQSIAFWEKIGFKTLSERQSPYPWAILSDGLSIIGLHQSNHFSGPAITYFASDMKSRIEKLIAGGLQDYRETGGPANIRLTTPEQQQVFLFSFGM